MGASIHVALGQRLSWWLPAIPLSFLAFLCLDSVVSEFNPPTVFNFLAGDRTSGSPVIGKVRWSSDVSRPRPAASLRPVLEEGALDLESHAGHRGLASMGRLAGGTKMSPPFGRVAFFFCRNRTVLRLACWFPFKRTKQGVQTQKGPIWVGLSPLP